MYSAKLPTIAYTDNSVDNTASSTSDARPSLQPPL